MNQLNVVDFVRRCAAEHTRTVDSRGSCDERSMRIASDYPARHSAASIPERACFISFRSWQTVSSQKGECQQSKSAFATETARATGFTTGRPPAQDTAGR